MSRDEHEQTLSELEAEIARTRAQLGRDVEGISYQLSPERFKEQAQTTLHEAQEAVMDTVNEMTDTVVEKTREVGSSFTDMVRRHPLPTALIGAGVVLLVVGGGVSVRRAHDDDDEYAGYGGRYGYGEGEYEGYVRPGYDNDPSARTGHTSPSYGAGRSFGSYDAYSGGYEAGGYGASSGRYSAGQYSAGQYGEGAGAGSSSYGGGGSSADGGQGLGQRAGEGTRQAKSQAKRAGRNLADFIEEQPLIAGLVTVVLGALVGLSLPGTRREDELLGSTRDHLAEQAREVAERAKAVAQKTFEEAKETARQEFHNVEDEAKADGESLLEKGKDAVKKVADDAKNTAKNEANKQKPS